MLVGQSLPAWGKSRGVWGFAALGLELKGFGLPCRALGSQQDSQSPITPLNFRCFSQISRDSIRQSWLMAFRCSWSKSGILRLQSASHLKGARCNCNRDGAPYSTGRWPSGTWQSQSTNRSFGLTLTGIAATRALHVPWRSTPNPC